MGEMVTKVAMVTLFDGDRALNINRGTYVEAPSEFFKKYDPKDLVNPSRPFDQKTDFHVKIVDWNGKPVVAAPPKTQPEAAAASTGAPKVEEGAKVAPGTPEAKKPESDAPKAKAPASMTSSSPLTGKHSKKGK
jgi:hypothetical protein